MLLYSCVISKIIDISVYLFLSVRSFMMLHSKKLQTTVDVLCPTICHCILYKTWVQNSFLSCIVLYSVSVKFLEYQY